MTPPETFVADTIAAVQRQIDAGHRLVSEAWCTDADGRLPGPCGGCALTLLAFDRVGVDATREALDARDEDGHSIDGETVLARLLAIDVMDVLSFAGGFDAGYPGGSAVLSRRDPWEQAGVRVRMHFDATGAL